MARQFSLLTLVSALFFLGATVIAATPPKAESKKMTIEGDVYDSACLYTKKLDQPVSPECAKQCAAGGSPLVILGTDGVVYLPVDDKMPAKSQNPLLVKFGAKRVKVTGDVFERGTSKAIVIKTIEEVKAAAKK